jgi:hypothetical protein
MTLVCTPYVSGAEVEQICAERAALTHDPVQLLDTGASLPLSTTTGPDASEWGEDRSDEAWPGSGDRIAAADVFATGDRESWRATPR